MKRLILIAACLAVLCLAVLDLWVYAKRTEPGGTPVPGKAGSDGQASNKSSPSTEQKALDPRVFELDVHYVFFGADQYSPCYVNSENKTLYRWKGVVLRGEQVPNKGPYQSLAVFNAKEFSKVVPIEAPVRYREVDGKYRAGCLDRSSLVFYEWKGIVLSKQELLDKSQDGKDAIVKPAFESQRAPEVVEIDMPTHAKEHPELWKKKLVAYSVYSGTGSDGQASNQSSPSTEQKAMDPHVFELHAKIAYFGDGQFSPCYMDLKNRILYRWRGVVLQREQLPFSAPTMRYSIAEAKDFSDVTTVEAPVKYREIDGKYRAGYLYQPCHVFYAWKGVVLSKQELLDKSPDGLDALLDPARYREEFEASFKDSKPHVLVNVEHLEVIEIDMPPHLKEHPELWKKKLVVSK